VRQVAVVGIIAVVLATAACASTGSVRTEPLAAGTTKTYTQSYAQVLAAARASLSEAGLALEEVTELDDSTSMLIGRKGQSFASYGEYVRLLVQRTSSSETAVRVLTKKKMATNVFAKGDYSQQIFSLIDSRLRAQVQ
jgi:hypothetical protein